jgi:hypothetical protein
MQRMANLFEDCLIQAILRTHLDPHFSMHICDNKIRDLFPWPILGPLAISPPWVHSLPCSEEQFIVHKLSLGRMD